MIFFSRRVSTFLSNSNPPPRRTDLVCTHIASEPATECKMVTPSPSHRRSTAFLGIMLSGHPASFVTWIGEDAPSGRCALLPAIQSSRCVFLECRLLMFPPPVSILAQYNGCRLPFGNFHPTPTEMWQCVCHMGVTVRQREAADDPVTRLRVATGGDFPQARSCILITWTRGRVFPGLSVRHTGLYFPLPFGRTGIGVPHEPLTNGEV